MKIGVMQPYFFPYIGYFDLIRRVDAWVVFDVVKYQEKSWMNRNRILHPTSGWQYVSVPVAQSSGQLIADTLIHDRPGSRDRILRQLGHYRSGGAPFFDAVRNLVGDSFAITSDSLCDLNVRAMELVCTYLGLTFSPRLLSRQRLDLPPISNAGSWALEISAALGADEYINLPGGTEYLDPEAFQRRGIKLTFAQCADFHYPTGKYAFVERLSILDILMWNAPGQVRAYLDRNAEAG